MSAFPPKADIGTQPPNIRLRFRFPGIDRAQRAMPRSTPRGGYETARFHQNDWWRRTAWPLVAHPPQFFQRISSAAWR